MIVIEYRGPFSIKELQDVKTMLRLTPLLISVVGFSCSQEMSWKKINTHKDDYSLISNIILNQTMSSLVSGILILIYQFVIYPCFYNYIPSMLKRMGLGLLCLMSSFLLVRVFQFGHNFIQSYDYARNIVWNFLCIVFSYIFGVHNSSIYSRMKGYICVFLYYL